MSTEEEALRDTAVRIWDAVIRDAWKAETSLKEFWQMLEGPGKGAAALIRLKVAEVDEHLEALSALADALDPPPPPEPKPERMGMSQLMRKRDIAEHIAGQFACHRSTCTEGATAARKLARWTKKPNKALLKRLRHHAGSLESVSRYILKALEEYEKADVVYPDFDIDGIPLEQMEAFVSLLAGTLPLSGSDE